jgi:hypothetical protein
LNRIHFSKDAPSCVDEANSYVAADDRMVLAAMIRSEHHQLATLKEAAKKATRRNHPAG